MDLKVKDVAELLNVSETTVCHWVANKQIPSYNLNEQFRFSCMEIENWMLQRKWGRVHGIATLEELESTKNNSNSAHVTSVSNVSNVSTSKPHREARGGLKQYSLYRALHRGNIILNVPGKNKEDLIRNMMSQVALCNGIEVDVDLMTELLLERENLSSTALGNGIAIPHTRESRAKAHQESVFVVFPEEPIPYEALDGKPVHTLFLPLSCDDKQHLQLLAKIAYLSSKPEALELLQSKPDKKQLLQFVKALESDNGQWA